MTTGDAVLITGAGSGIGRATATIFARLGTRLTLFDQAPEALAETVATVDGQDHLAIEGDVSCDQSVRDAVAATVNRYGRLDAAICCAGVEVMGTVPEMALEDWTRVISVNLTGTFLTARHAIPAIEAVGGGSFVAVSSDAGVQGASGFAAYCASKHGVLGLVRSLALDHGPTGVRSNAVCPGFVETPMADRIFADAEPEERRRWEDTVPLGRFAQPIEVAEVIAHLASDQAKYTNGLTYMVDGGSTAGYFEA